MSCKVKKVNLMKLGEKIKALRKGKYTQEKLAELIDVHVNTLLRWERGERIPTADKLKALADVLGTTPSELLSSDDVTQKEKPDDEKEAVPYTQEQVNKGMLVYVLNNGERIELPPIKASYDFLRDIAIHAVRPAVMA